MWSRSGPNAAQVTGYRVYRDGRFYKRVRGLSMRVRASRLHTYRVAASGTDGRPGAKSGVVKVIRRHRPPGRPGRLKRRVTDSEVRLSWSRSSRRSGKIAGYRIYRDRVLVRQVRGRRARDRDLAPGTRYRFTVAAIDTHGYMGPAARVIGEHRRSRPDRRGSAHAFLLASTGESFRDLQRHYRQVGTVYPTYFECEKTRGALVGEDDPLVTRWAQLRRIRVLPRFDCQKPAALHLILTDPSVRAATISGIVALVRKHGYEGINIDFENGPATDRDALTAFVSDLAKELHAIGKDLSVEVSAKFQHTTTGRSGLYDYEALGAAADHVFVMNWGWHWSTSAPGRAGRHGEVPAGRRLRRIDAEQGAVRARHAHVRHGLARGGRAGAHRRGARVRGRAGPDRRSTGRRRCSTRVRRVDVQLHRRRAASRTRCGTRTPPRSRGG